MKHETHNTQSWLRAVKGIRGRNPFTMRSLPEKLQIRGPSIKQLESKGYVRFLGKQKVEGKTTLVSVWAVII